jgi:hypothetical protein
VSQQTTVSCHHCGKANDPSRVECAACQTRLRGLRDDDVMPLILVAPRLKTELHLRCMPGRLLDEVRFVANSGHAPEVDATFETGATKAAPPDLSALLAPFATLGTPIKAKLAFGARIELATVERVTDFHLLIELKDPLTAVVVARGTWNGAQLPHGPIQLALQGETAGRDELMLVATLKLATPDRSRELTLEQRALPGQQPVLRFVDRSVHYELPLQLSLQRAAVTCLRIDTRHQLANSGRSPDANRSSATPLPVQVDIQFNEAGRYRLWLPPELVMAAEAVKLRRQDGQPLQAKQGTLIFAADANELLRLEATFVPRLLPTSAGLFGENDQTWQFEIPLMVQSLDAPSASPMVVLVARIQLWAAQTTSPAVAIDFGTSATSLRLMRQNLDDNAFGETKSSAAAVDYLDQLLSRPAYGSFRQTAITALRVEQHGDAGAVPRNNTVGSAVFEQLEAGDNIYRSVSLIKRLLSESWAVYLTENSQDALGTQRVASSQSYPAPALAEAFLRTAALDLAAEGVLPNTVMLSYPATWNTAKLTPVVQAFLGLVQRAFQGARDQQRPDLASTPVVVQQSLSEPEALLFYQLATADREPAMKALIDQATTLGVVDVGGGTTDVALVRPKAGKRGKKELFPVLSDAFDLAGEDITHAIAREIWRHLVNYALGKEGTGSDRADLAAIRKLRFPSSAQQRFSLPDSDLQSAAATLQRTFKVAEKVKLGVALPDDIDDIPLTGCSQNDLIQAAMEPIREIALKTNDVLKRLADKLGTDGAAAGCVAIILGGNATRYEPLRDLLKKEIEANAGLHGKVSVATMGANAKDGVSMGVMLKLVVDTEDSLAELLPFKWGSDGNAEERRIWNFKVKISPIKELTLSTEVGGVKLLSSIVWNEATGFDHLQIELTCLAPSGTKVANLSPTRTAALRALWSIAPLQRDDMKKARVELLDGDLLQLTFDDYNGESFSRSVPLAKLLEENTP